MNGSIQRLAARPLNRFVQRSRRAIERLVAIAVLAGAGATVQALDIPGADGSDGALVVTGFRETRTIDLAQAITGNWDDPGSGAGVYDPDEWLVVFKLTELTMNGSGGSQRLRFSNHPSGAPVVMLVDGDVTINSGATVDLDGGSQRSDINAGAGPGGFGGGVGFQDTEVTAQGAGFGPGGGQARQSGDSYGGSGSHSTPGTDGQAAFADSARTYGNPRALPLVGGSGGGGSTSDQGGAGGGGAILIAATGTITVDGLIRANGGGANFRWNSGTASGGAIRLVAETIGGTGQLQTVGSDGSDRPTEGGDGYIRLEANSAFGNLLTLPLTNVVAPDEPVLIVPPAGSPTVRVVSVDGVDAPADPYGMIGTGTTDLVLDGVPSANIVLETTNVEAGAEVEVHIVPKHGPKSIIPAVFQAGDFNLATWSVSNVDLPQTFFVVQGYARNPAP